MYFLKLSYHIEEMKIFNLVAIDEYILTTNHLCTEHVQQLISEKWNDGTATGWKTPSNIEHCKKNCSDHAECQGFMHIPVQNMCSLWVRAPISPKPQSPEKPEVHCYEKYGSFVYLIIVNSA